MSSSIPNYLPQTPSSKTIPLGVRTSTYEFQKNASILEQSTTWSMFHLTLPSRPVLDTFKLKLAVMLLRTTN